MNRSTLFSGSFYEDYTKRFVDIVLSLLLLIFFFPVCVILAVVIKLTSPGPIFADVPNRVGRNGQRFKMFKFPSMIVNAHHLLPTNLKNYLNNTKKAAINFIMILVLLQ